MSARQKLIPDTNVIIRYLLRDVEAQYAEAEAFFEAVRLGKKQAVILESVLVECLYILTKFYQVPRREAADALAGLLHYKGTVVAGNSDCLHEALVLFGSGALDPVDCLVVAHGRQQGLPVVSFDKKLKKKLAAQKK